MRAAWYERNGPAAEVIEVGDLPTPEPGPGEARVRVAWSGLNPTDVKRRSGFRGQQMGFPRVVPHQDGAGIIDKVGDGVPAARLGERVWLYNAQAGRAFGTAAEYIALPAKYAVRLPDAAPLSAGACIGVPVRTAHRALFADGSVKGKTVLVQGGAGAVGNYAIQLAKWGGARVLTTVSSPEKARLAGAAGADVVIDYRKEDVAACVLAETGGAGVDHIVEVSFGKNMPVTLAVLKPFGIVAAYASDADQEPKFPYYDLMAKNAVIRLVFLYEVPADYVAPMERDIAAWLASGKAFHAMARTFRLDEVAAAHAYLESGATAGNVMIEVAGG
ncbi:MAG: NADPH:quinone reductase [Alphaproteobacteria bacterium]|nr:NADPH:quinone reductase [Alphaproteobacteria bacterium]